MKKTSIVRILLGKNELLMLLASRSSENAKRSLTELLPQPSLRLRKKFEGQASVAVEDGGTEHGWRLLVIVRKPPLSPGLAAISHVAGVPVRAVTLDGNGRYVECR